MGFLVPPPFEWSMTINLDEAAIQQMRWLCLYCHTIQEADRLTCCNCGAPHTKPRPDFVERLTAFMGAGL
ncbi:MAG TPA: hypothetical protein PL187_13605 [Caldilinea sp.]|nr:hypothetical protein [Caldilinea sp.]